MVTLGAVRWVSMAPFACRPSLGGASAINRELPIEEMISETTKYNPPEDDRHPEGGNPKGGTHTAWISSV